MGTTRIKVIDLSSDQKEIKTSRKHAEKLAGATKIKKTEKGSKETKVEKPQEASHAPQDIETHKIEKIDEQETKTADSSGRSTLREEPSGSDSMSSSVTSVSSKKRLHHKGAKYLAAKKLVADKVYSTKEALELLPRTSITKFDPAVEVHLNVTDKNIKAKVSFPHTTGLKQKAKRYLIFSDLSSKALAKEEKPLAKSEKNVIAANEKSIADIESGNLKPGKDFDVVIASPKFMPTLTKIAKILGPRGLMPNPKTGTILDDPLKYFTAASTDFTEFNTDPTAPIIHAKIGKLSQGEKELEENLKALIFAIGPAKIQKAIIKSTMSPSIRLDLSSL